jgi:hypothetical protein
MLWVDLCSRLKCWPKMRGQLLVSSWMFCCWCRTSLRVQLFAATMQPFAVAPWPFWRVGLDEWSCLDLSQVYQAA